MLNKLKLLLKMIFFIGRGKVVNNLDYGLEYDKVSDTYSLWTNRMGRHVDSMLRTDLMDHSRELRILDLACGNGYISNHLLENGISCKLSGVDISTGMIDCCRQRFSDDNLEFLVQDGAEYLAELTEMFDAIFCGWALPYFNQKVVLANVAKRLKPGGITGFISNVEGTLEGLQDIFLTVMAKQHTQVKKVLTISSSLPSGKEQFCQWFEKQGLECLDLAEGEEVVNFSTPDELLDWLLNTGAAAGTNSIFENISLVRDDLIDELSRRMFKNGSYAINHKFVYGTFRKSL